MKLSLVGVTKSFSGRRVLDSIGLDFLPGTVTCLIGLNGAGKSTLLRCCAGLLGPTAGSVWCNGEPLERDNLALRRRMCFLPDDPPFLNEATVLSHLALVLNLYRPGETVAPDSVVALLRDFDLLPHAERPLAELSRGQRYKTALIGLLLSQATLWLLDEPFASGMDPQGMAAFKRHARAAAACGTTILYSTQILEIAERFADRIVVLDGGEVRLDLDSAALRAMPADGPGSLEERLCDFREPQP
jgi:ABC-type multidrug transport system ATPase subunit